MTGDFSKLRGFSYYICRACDCPGFETHCVLRVPEFEGFDSALPCMCPYKMIPGAKWELNTMEVISND